MKTAKEYSAAAALIGQTAEQIRPAEGDEFSQPRNVAVFHLRSAQKLMREVAEAKASWEALKS